MTIPLTGGLPHSEIRGSKGARPSSRLIAACHVLLRLSVPRHPPDALTLTLDLSPTRRDMTSEREAGKCFSHCAWRFGCRFSVDGCRGPTTDNRQLTTGSVTHTTLFTISNNFRPRTRRNSTPCTSDDWWRRTGLNRRPPACKAGALPLSYAPPR